MEASHVQRRNVYDCTTGELVAILASEFGGRAPTTEELQEFLRSTNQEAGRDHGINR